MGRRRELILEGVPYPTLQAACDAYGRDRTTVQWRVSHGMSYEEAILTAPDSTKNSVKSITFDGITYRSISEFTSAKHLPRSIIKNAEEAGISLEDYADREYYRFGDKFCFSIREVAEVVGTTEAKLHAFRRNNLWVSNAKLARVWMWFTTQVCPGYEPKTVQQLSKERSFVLEELWMYYDMYGSLVGADFGEEIRGVQPVTENTVSPPPYVIEGRGYYTKQQIADAYNVSTTTLNSRVNSGMTLEEAAIYKGPNAIEIDGKWYSDAKEACEAYGTSLNDYNNNRNDGMSKVEAIKAGHVDRRGRGGNPTPITVAGKTYPSFNAACRHYGVLPQTVQSRMERYHVSAEDALLGNYTSDNPRAPKSYIWNGETYVGIGVLAEAMGVNRITLGAHLSAGETPEEAYVAILENTTFSFEGKTYGSLAEAAQVFGVTPNAVRSRLRKKWSLSDALKTPLMQRGEQARKPVVVDGVPYDSLGDAADAFDIASDTVSARLSSGWDLERALKTPVNKRNPPVEVVIDGKTYPSKQAAYDAFRIPKHIVQRRVKKGMDLETALKTPVEQGTKIIWCGKVYTSIEDYCSARGASLSRVKRLVKQGLPVEEAVEEILKSPLERERGEVTEFLASLNITRPTWYRALHSCDGDYQSTVTLLNLIFADKGEVTFHGKTFPTITEACRLLEITQGTVASHMCNNVTFEDAVHFLFYVVGDTVCINFSDMSKKLGVPRNRLDGLNRQVRGLTKDEFVKRIPQEWFNAAPKEADTLRLSRANTQIASATGIGDGLFLCECTTCHRFIKVTLDEGLAFKHDDVFCEEHCAKELQGLNLTIESIREMVRRAGSYTEAVNRYHNSHPSSIAFRARRGSAVANLKKVLPSMYIVRCAICGRDVTVPVSDIEVFQHSEDYCASREWEGYSWDPGPVGHPKNPGIITYIPSE